MNRLRIMLMLSIALCLQACICRTQSSRDFISSLEGEIVFYDASRAGEKAWRMLDFSGAAMHTRSTAAVPQGVLSPNKEWRLTFVEEADTNGDGVIDYHDRSSVYLSRVGSAEKKRINLPYPVGTCTWGAAYMTAACSFAAKDVSPELEAETGDNSVYYVVNLESNELLQRLSDPYKTSWSLVWSPDGSRVAFEVGSRLEDRWVEEGVQVIEVSSGGLVYEFSDPIINGPIWSPDGTRLAFAAVLESGWYTGALVEHMYWDVFYIDLRDEPPTLVNTTRTSRFSEIPGVLTHLGGIGVVYFIWSPDGEAIASIWKRDGGQQVWITSVEGDDWARVARGFDHSYFIEWRP